MQLPIPDDGFNEAHCDRAIEQLNIGDINENEVKQPPQLKTDDWDVWEQTFENYLKSLHGVTGTPLNYIIRDPTKTAADFPAADEANRLIYSVRLNGPVYKEDNSRVAQELFSLISSSGAESFVDKHSNDSRDMMNHLHAHYNGPGKVNK